MDTIDKIIFNCVDKALSQFDSEGKRVFYHILEESYGVKPPDMADDFEIFHSALRSHYGNRHFKIQSLIIRCLQESNRLRLYERTAQLDAFRLVVDVFGREMNDTIKSIKEFSNLAQYTEELQKKVKNYDEQLKRAERMVAIGETAGMVGHDIRNPLQAMTGDIYLIRSEVESLPKGTSRDSISESLDSLENNIAYINKIVADLQDYAKPLNPEYAMVNFADLVTKLFKTINLPAKVILTTGIEVPPQIRTEPTFLKRILTNLINNAIQAMPNGGKLDVSASINAGKLAITVSDTGNGIPDEVKDKLFKPMVTTKSKGQGFGLAVVKRLVDALKGTISFESKNGEGTKFSIKLPFK